MGSRVHCDDEDLNWPWCDLAALPRHRLGPGWTGRRWPICIGLMRKPDKHHELPETRSGRRATLDESDAFGC
jgi:hypothetical protein